PTQRHIVASSAAADDAPRQSTLGMLDGDTHSRHQRSRGVSHGPQNSRHGSLSKNQGGSQCDCCNKRCYESSKRTQTGSRALYHLRSFRLRNYESEKQIWQASRPSSRPFIPNLLLYKNRRAAAVSGNELKLWFFDKNLATGLQGLSRNILRGISKRAEEPLD